MADQVSDEPKKTAEAAPRFRSPPYPAINLAKAVERVGQLYPKSLHHFVPIAVLADAWDYEVKSSGLAATIAALKQFGFMVDQAGAGGRRFQLSEAALRIARDPNPTSVARVAALKTAALAPKIHSELWEQYGVAGTAGSMDVALKSHLMVDRVDNGEAPFSDKAAEQLIEEYKASVAFAGLTNTTFEILLPSKGQGASEIVENTHILDKSKGGVPPPADLTSQKRIAGEGFVEESTNLDEGDVVLTLPEKMSQESYEDLKVWLDYILKKHARRAGVVKPKPTGDEPQ